MSQSYAAELLARIQAKPVGPAGLLEKVHFQNKKEAEDSNIQSCSHEQLDAFDSDQLDEAGWANLFCVNGKFLRIYKSQDGDEGWKANVDQLPINIHKGLVFFVPAQG